MSGDRPSCPRENCNTWGNESRGLYSRPRGKYQRHPELWECAGCGAIFFAVKAGWGWKCRVVLLDRNTPPPEVLDRVQDLQADDSRSSKQALEGLAKAFPHHNFDQEGDDE